MGADITQDDGKAWGRKNNMQQTPVNDQESRGVGREAQRVGQGPDHKDLGRPRGL